LKNIWISLGIFTLMIIAMFLSLDYLDKVCTLVENNSAELETLINEEKWLEADKLSNQLYYSWIKEAKVMSIFVNHAEIDMMNNEILKLTQYVKCKSKDEALASSHVIKFYSKSIVDLQKVNISNIF
jgi:hypothetical protein